MELPELPGCLTQGETLEEAYAMAEDAKKAWILDALEQGEKIPVPEAEDNYSGRFNIRIPKSLHKKLAENAAREKVSLNQYVLYQLARSVGIKI